MKRRNWNPQPCFLSATLSCVKQKRSFRRDGDASFVPPSTLLERVHLTNDAFHHRNMQLSASLWGRITSSTNSLSTPNASLALAFLMGGIFFAKLLPRFLAFAALLFQHFTKARQTKRSQSQQQQTDYSHHTGQKSGNMVRFTTIRRSGLIAAQYVAERLAGRSFQTQLRRALQEGLSQVSNPNIRDIEIESFVTNPTPQKTPPRLRRGRIYDAENSMVFDVDIEWKNCLDAQLQITTKRLGLYIPIRVHNCKFRGPIRIILTPLIHEPPGFGACLVSFPRIPQIDMDVTVAGGQITRVAWLKQEIMDAMRDLLAKEMVWPNRAVNPALQEQPNVTRISIAEIQELKISDPFLESETKFISNHQMDLKSRKNTTEGTSLWNRVVDGVLQPFFSFAAKGTSPTSAVQSAAKFISSSVVDTVSSANATQPAPPNERQGLGKEKQMLNGDTRNVTATSKNDGWNPSWDKLFDSLVRPFEVSKSIDSLGKNTNSTTKSTDNDGALDIAQAIKNMSNVESFDEFVALFGSDE